MAPIELPSDYDGVLYTPYDGDSGAWRSELVAELRERPQRLRRRSVAALLTSLRCTCPTLVCSRLVADEIVEPTTTICYSKPGTVGHQVGSGAPKTPINKPISWNKWLDQVRATSRLSRVELEPVAERFGMFVDP